MTRSLAVVLLLAACGHAAAPAPVGQVTENQAEVPPLPCGARSVEELEANARAGMGSCAVISEGEYFELHEHGRPVLHGGEAKPLVAVDPRIPGPAGLRVGMTIADVRAAAPAYAWLECTAFPGIFQCELRRVETLPDCGEGDRDDAIWIELGRPAGLQEGDELSGDDAWSRLEGAALTGVVLSMPC